MLSAKLKEAAGNGIASTLYVDDVFSTWLYTGNGSTQTITNGIDLAGKGGLVWWKRRDSASYAHMLVDTARGSYSLSTDNPDNQYDSSTLLTSMNSNGFSIGSSAIVNGNAATYASWTFRKAAKFFDVVTYTGTGSARTIAHSLGIAPGMVIVKRTDTTGDWQVYSNGLTSAAYSIQLNLTNAQASATTVWNSTAPTSSVFSVGTDATVNASGGTYVAYLFAHDTSANGIIQCGSYTGNGSATGPNVSLGWEPQYLMIKNASGTGNWQIIDSMRGMPVGSADATLQANLSSAESSVEYLSPTATGFQITSTSTEVNTSGSTYIYMAIRRPNKPPTTGTQVYYPVARSGTGATGSSTSFGQVTDLVFTKQRGSTQTWAWTDRLRGATKELTSAATTVETAYANDLTGFDTMTGFYFGSGASGQMNTSGSNYDDHLFRRAPGFFDVVCYTGTGSATTQAHELTVVPELIIAKERSAANDWWVYNITVGNTKYSVLNSTAIPVTSSTAWNNTTPTASVFSIGTSANVNASAQTYVAYLFATLAGISKVGSYTGNGTTQTINCGFTGGARFVLIKRTDSTGDWYVFDTTRGMTTLTDPYLLLNSTAAEVATLGAVTSVTTGFAVNAAIVAAINTNAASYIFLAIA